MAIWGRFPTFWLLKILKIKEKLQNKMTKTLFECLSSVTLALSNHLRNIFPTDDPSLSWSGTSQDLSKPRVPELSWGAQGDDTLSSQEGKVFQFWKLRSFSTPNILSTKKMKGYRRGFKVCNLVNN